MVVGDWEVTKKDLVPKRRRKRSEDDGLFSVSEFDGESVGELDGVVNELVVGRSEFGGVRISLFSEGEEEDEDDWEIEGVGDADYLL